ncbi:magnesium transporter [Brevibacterium sp. JNUCC-42]|nr:magnesium transporter [Brevibacterium sp. JNUCC-42]
MTAFSNQSQSYKAQSTGSMMKSDFFAIQHNQTVDEVIQQFRQQAKRMTRVHNLYVIDPQGRLIGVLSLRELLIAPANQTISEVMKSEVVSVPVDMDQEDAVKLLQKHDFVSLPVITDVGKLVGILHVDEILDVAEEEATEDFHKMAPVTNLGKNIKEAGIFFLYRKRIVWLVFLVFMNIFSGAGIAYFEDTIAASISLVFFLPLLVDSGGNAGSQSATLMIRALAVGDIRLRDWTRLFAKEIGVSILMGLTMAAAVSVLGIFRGGFDIAVVISLTMVLIVIVGSLIGMSLPFLLSKMKLDPATASGPLITSLADIIGVLIYFSIATWYLSL